MNLLNVKSIRTLILSTSLKPFSSRLMPKKLAQAVSTFGKTVLEMSFREP